MPLKKHLLYNLNWSCFTHTVTCGNVTMPQNCKIREISHGWIFCFLSCETRFSTRFSIACFRFSILDSQLAQESRIVNWVENRDSQWTVNLLLNGTVTYKLMPELTVLLRAFLWFWLLNVSMVSPIYPTIMREMKLVLPVQVKQHLEEVWCTYLLDHQKVLHSQ